jgi:hypothetical protein
MPIRLSFKELRDLIEEDSSHIARWIQSRSNPFSSRSNRSLLDGGGYSSK